MKPERLEEIRDIVPLRNAVGSEVPYRDVWAEDAVSDLLAYIDELEVETRRLQAVVDAQQCRLICQEDQLRYYTNRPARLWEPGASKEKV